MNRPVRTRMRGGGVPGVQWTVRNYIEDGGRSSEVGLQEQASNHCKLQ